MGTLKTIITGTLRENALKDFSDGDDEVMQPWCSLFIDYV